MQPTFKIVPLEAWHLAEIDLQDEQKYFEAKCQDVNFRVAIAREGGETAILDYGEGKAPVILGCAGVMRTVDGVGIAWSVLSKYIGKYMTRSTRYIKKYLQEKLATEFHRIEMCANDEFKAACRWAEMLGFEYESTKRQATEYRQDVRVYVMIREEV